MGDRANVLVREDHTDPGVYLYTHWSGSDLPTTLQVALAKKLRWGDGQYLTRIIFDTMSAGEQGQECGYGISAHVRDGDDRILTVNCEDQTVRYERKRWTFTKYIGLTEDQLATVWD